MLENRIPPPILTLVIAIGMGAASQAMPPLAVPALVRVALAVAVFMVAGLFGAPAVRAFAQAGTTINPVRIDNASALVSTGIYGLSRNPMYVGLAGILLSLGIYLGRPWLLIGPVLFVAFISRFQIIPEERAMQARFGDAYTAYRARVRRWL